MKNKTMPDEIAYLEKVNKSIKESIHLLQQVINNAFQKINDLQKYLTDSHNEMDDAEIANIEIELNTSRASLAHSKSRFERLEKINKSPYFGRIDFTLTGNTIVQNIYIGLQDFQYNSEHLIYDWRAPISAMFYNFKLGEAQYQSPSGIKTGILSLKRQYKIDSGVIQYMFDTSLNIDDEILQQELSSTTSNRMRNIINTIQTEQNNIIRNEDDPILIIQGHAGSGKTSIALHRIAFLLYRHRDQLKSQDILIISPNKIFSDYISNVLPELGEEALTQMNIEEVIKHYFDFDINFTSSYDAQSDNLSDLYAYISSLQIIADLDKYADYLKRTFFTPTLLKCKGETLTPKELLKYSRRCGGKTMIERKERLCEYIIDELEYRTNKHVTKQEKRLIKEQLNTMYHTVDFMKDYCNFFEFIGKPEFIPKNLFPFPHIFSYLYLKFKLDLITPINEIRHIVIDEMQDYPPIMFALLNNFFKSPMTILGDIYQSISADSHSDINDLKTVLLGSTILYLTKSYRSTLEIMTLAQHILPADNIEIISRHGKTPSIYHYTNKQNLQEIIAANVKSILNTKTESIAIITRTDTAAQYLYKLLFPLLPQIHLLTPSSTVFKKGVSVISTSIAKGLEFDYVIIPDADYDNYHTELDKHHLYVAITRAKHSIDIFYKNKISPFLENAPAAYIN